MGGATDLGTILCVKKRSIAGSVLLAGRRLVAQASHTATVALHLHCDHQHATAYLQELWCMHKVVHMIPGDTTLKELAETLQQKNVDHILWLEQPENTATCIALWLSLREEVN